MATVTGKPYPGPFIINLEDLRDKLIDLPDGATRGLRSEQEGFPRVLAVLARSVPAHGEAAGVSLRVYARIVENTGTIDTLAQHEGDLEKLVEIVRETRKKLEHDREHDVGLIVDVVESTAQRTGDTALRAAFEEVIRYKNQIAAKATQTRRKNAAAKDEDEAPADGDNA
jgi:vacuolar-type H+-ATPase subunit H